MNLFGALAIPCTVYAFTRTRECLGHRSLRTRLVSLAGFTALAIPALLFDVYYLHVLPEWAWFYTLRSWSGSEFLVLLLGCAAGAGAALLPRRLYDVPLFALLALAYVPYLKPEFAPLPDKVFQERWEGDICLQSTPSTCDPASVATILRRLGHLASEKTIARAAFTSQGGTEAWYLARYVRSQGLVPRFDFSSTLEPPALVGVRLGSAGHFIAVLEISSGQVTFADPLSGEERLPLSKFEQRYQFTGFHMAISRPPG